MLIASSLSLPRWPGLVTGIQHAVAPVRHACKGFWQRLPLGGCPLYQRRKLYGLFRAVMRRDCRADLHGQGRIISAFFRGPRAIAIYPAFAYFHYSIHVLTLPPLGAFVRIPLKLFRVLGHCIPYRLAA